MQKARISVSERIYAFQRKILDAGIDFVLLSYSRSILYYAGTTQPSILVVTPGDYHLLVIRGLDWVLQETWLVAEKITLGSGYDEVKDRLRNWKIEKGHLGVELDVLPAGQYLKLSELFSEFSIVDISKLVLEQRKTKDATEIEYTREACRIVHQGHQRILDVLRDGMTELELSWK